MLDESGKETFSTVNEVIELSQATLDAALFEVPSDYREVKNAGEMYASSSVKNMPQVPSTNNSAISSGTASSIQKQVQVNVNNSVEANAKQPGIVRIGIMTKIGAVSSGVAAADLAAAINNTLGEYLKGTKVELVLLEAKLVSLIENEAKQKECDFVLLANVSHKKGGGGFGGMFGKTAGEMLGSVVPMAGGVGSAIAGQVASTVITSAAISSSFKSKDEITLEINLKRSGGAAVLTQKFTAKAKSDSEDILSKVVEQAAQAIANKAG